MSTPKTAILRHARERLAGLGKIEIRDGHFGAYGIYEATVVLTSADKVEYYHACANSSAVGLVKARTEKLPELPLFSHASAAEDT